MSAAITLEGKVAIITGASRGIGEAIARAFVGAGARVVLAARKPEALERVVESLGDKAIAVPCHTGHEDQCGALVEAAERRFGTVDVLVNNAATNPYFGPFVQAEMGAWDKTFEVNVKGYFWLARNVARAAIARGAPASIVNVASVAGLRAAPLQGIYAMSKAAILSMTQTLAVELAPSRIRVNAIAPGFVDTRFASAVLHDDTLVAEVRRRTPLGRYGVPDEIAGGALYLASDSAAFLTGHTLVIDGGMTIG